MNKKDKILKYIDDHREEAIDFLKTMIQFDSSSINQGVHGKEKDIQEWLASKLQQWGFETELFEPKNEEISHFSDYNPGHHYENRPNLIATLKGTGNGRSLILNGHVDTVATGDLAKWTHGPWDGEISDGKMFGRGTTDMKAGVSAMILATRFLQQAGFELEGDIMIQSVVDEEGGGNGTLACVAKGYRADAAIITEPTNLHVQPIGRGVLLLEVDVTGKSVHACYKWEGVNAIEKALKIANGLKELEHEWLAKKRNPLLPSPTINLGYLKGGLEAPIVPDQCTMKFDIKYLPVEYRDGVEVKVTGDMVKNEVEKYIHGICLSDPWLVDHPPILNWYLHVMPHHLDLDHELISTAKSATEEILGWSKVSGLPSGSDARHLLNSGGIPSIVFGPGDMKKAHSIDESISLNDYIDGIKVLALTIMDWTSQKRTDTDQLH